MCFLFQTSKVTLMLLFSFCCDKRPEVNNLNGKDVFRLEISKVSSTLAGHNAVACGEQNMWQSKAARERERERGRGCCLKRHTSSKSCSNDPIPQAGPTCHGCRCSQHSIQRWIHQWIHSITIPEHYDPLSTPKHGWARDWAYKTWALGERGGASYLNQIHPKLW